MMKALILICSAATSQPDCSIDTAADVIQGPETASFAHCGFMGQAYLADTALADRIEDGHYLKVVCTSRDLMDAHLEPEPETTVDQAAEDLPATDGAVADDEGIEGYRVGIGTSPR